MLALPTIAIVVIYGGVAVAVVAVAMHWLTGGNGWTMNALRALDVSVTTEPVRAEVNFVESELPRRQRLIFADAAAELPTEWSNLEPIRYTKGWWRARRRIALTSAFVLALAG